jgi:hypothetical protein
LEKALEKAKRCTFTCFCVQNTRVQNMYREKKGTYLFIFYKNLKIQILDNEQDMACR